jgi:hypothetical protein
MTFTREDPSPRYRELLGMYQVVHDEGIADQAVSAEEAFSGGSLKRQMPIIRALIKATGSKTVLDYGSGKGSYYRAKNFDLKGQRVSSVQEYWSVEHVTCFDPGYAPFAKVPAGTFDAVICTDVLEHLPEEDLTWVIEEQFRYAKKFIFANIASYPANKILPNGENAHCTIKPKQWWRDLAERSRAAAGSSAEYYWIVETKQPRWIGRPKAVFEPITSKADWPPKDM